MDKIGFLLLRMNILILIVPECVVKINGFAHNKKGPRSDPGAGRESDAQKGIGFHAERVGNLALDVELAPYKPKMVTAGDLNLIIRELKVYMGALNYEFDPNSAIGTLWGTVSPTPRGSG